MNVYLEDDDLDIEVGTGYSDEDIDSPDTNIDLDDDLELEAGEVNVQGDVGDTEDGTDVVAEDLDIEYDANFTSIEGTDQQKIAPITFTESSVRVFQRSGYNVIMEADLSAVMGYYGHKLSEDECIGLIAEAHNLSEDTLVVMINEDTEVEDNPKVKTAKPAKKVSPLDSMINNLIERKKKMTGDAWNNSPLKRKLKELRAKRVLQQKK